MTILPKIIYRFNAISIIISMGFFTEKTNDSKICLKIQRLQLAKMKLWKKNKSGGINSQFQTIQQSYSIKILWDWHKNRHIDQQNRIESPEMILHLYQLIYDKEVKNIQCRKYVLFNKWCCKNWIAKCKK